MRRNTYAASCANVVNIFCPSMIQSSPSRTARVFAAATSEPESGSVYPRAKMISPARNGGRNLCFCSSEPTARMVRPTITDCPSPSVGTPARRSSSRIAVISNGSRPCPPYSTGHDAAIQPRAPSAR